MKSILFIAFLALATIGCDTPEKSTGSDTTAPPMSDTAAQQMGTDTAASMPVDTTTSMPNPSDTTRTDTTRIR
jgi:PBP1b-binding outer membrane lipoprotein LpoB